MLPTCEADLADVLAYLLNDQIAAVREFLDSCCWNHLIAGCSSASLLYFKVDHGWIKIGDTHADMLESFFPSDIAIRGLQKGSKRSVAPSWPKNMFF